MTLAGVLDLRMLPGLRVLTWGMKNSWRLKWDDDFSNEVRSAFLDLFRAWLEHGCLSLSTSQIPQLYLNMPASAGEPPSVLKGFTNVTVQPSENKSVTINLSRYDLSFWDTIAQALAHYVIVFCAVRSE
jgi:hypothetical protein